MMLITLILYKNLHNHILKMHITIYQNIQSSLLNTVVCFTTLEELDLTMSASGKCIAYTWVKTKPFTQLYDISLPVGP